MEYLKEEEVAEPVSPTGQYLNSEALSLCVLGVLETGVPITADDSQVESLVNDVFLPTNPRFSSIMVEHEKGEKLWKKVEVKIKDHIKIPIFPSGMSPKTYDKYVDDYISVIAMEKFPKTKPLWEIHIINYPTSNNNIAAAAGTVIFKLHHSIGDGFSLVGALLSCLQRADDPSLPLTFPSAPSRLTISDSDGTGKYSINGFLKNTSKIFSLLSNTVSDFCWSIMKSSFLEDDHSPIRSGDFGIEFRPITTATTTFNLDQMKQIKSNIGATINDVITGVIFLGTRLYMKEMSPDSINTNSTTLVLLNTREFRSYIPAKDMVKTDAKTPWGNYFTFLHVPIPKLSDDGDDSKLSNNNPLEFVRKAREIINVKKSSLAAHLTGRFLQILKKFRGPEAAARYIHGTLQKTSMAITNLVGPVEQLALAKHPIAGIYFLVAGAPQSLSITVISYMGKLRVVVVAEKGFIDAQKLKSCIENAFQMISEAACKNN
ncbi:hypothetical protein Dsin_031398 [Dipteronia sinensis]|uniref:Diacylglycerol O-acyltransferase n=1 Tax=Dipteronia sinensis TaxID=43782 RepID=A0AAE0DSD0_9ROSI|nr:hypothetical protein Dsin_031398 [Dipteronia sinensis]